MQMTNESMKRLFFIIALLAPTVAYGQHYGRIERNGQRAGLEQGLIADSIIAGQRKAANEAAKFGDQRILKNRQAYLKWKTAELKKEKQKQYLARKVNQKD